MTEIIILLRIVICKLLLHLFVIVIQHKVLNLLTIPKAKTITLKMVYPKQLIELYDKLEVMCREAGLIAGKSGRHMKYPYTISAKIAQFPLFHYMRNNNIWMYYPLGCLVSVYVFAKIHILSNSEANKKSWAETQRRIAEKEQKH